MASIADITLANYAAVAKTFAARSSDGSLATWNEMSSGLYIGNPIVTLGQRLPGPNVRTYKVSYKVKLPTMAVTAYDDVWHSTVSYRRLHEHVEWGLRYGSRSAACRAT